MKSGNGTVCRATTGVPVIGDFWGFTTLVLGDMNEGTFTGALSLLPLDFLRHFNVRAKRNETKRTLTSVTELEEI